MKRKTSRIIGLILALVFALSALTVALAVTEPDPSRQKDIYLLLDNSGSMYATHLNRLKAAAKDFCRNVTNNSCQKNYVCIITYGGEPQAYEFSADYAYLEGIIDGLQSKGDTYMYDALDMVSGLKHDRTATKHIVIMADGLPNVGLETDEGKYSAVNNVFHYKYANSVYNLAQEYSDNNYNIYTVGFFPCINGYEFGFGATLLQDIANAVHEAEYNYEQLKPYFVTDCEIETTTEKKQEPLTLPPEITTVPTTAAPTTAAPTTAAPTTAAPTTAAPADDTTAAPGGLNLDFLGNLNLDFDIVGKIKGLFGCKDETTTAAETTTIPPCHFCECCKCDANCWCRTGVCPVCGRKDCACGDRCGCGKDDFCVEYDPCAPGDPHMAKDAPMHKGDAKDYYRCPVCGRPDCTCGDACGCKPMPRHCPCGCCCKPETTTETTTAEPSLCDKIKDKVGGLFGGSKKEPAKEAEPTTAASKTAQTGDRSAVAAIAALALLGGAAIVVTRKH